MNPVEAMPLSSPPKTLTIALAGNPNSGKSTLFNALTRLRQKVGNYPGVTVEKKLGRTFLPDGRAVNVLDLPGTYSLTVRSLDEKVACDVLLGRMPDTPAVDIVVCVADVTNLERNLYLVTQIQDLGLPVVVALNMMDDLASQGKTIDAGRLARELGAPVVPMTAVKGRGVAELRNLLTQNIPLRTARGWTMTPILDQEVERLALWLKDYGFPSGQSFSEALRLITMVDRECAVEKPVQEMVAQARGRLTEAGVDWRSAVIEARYAWLHGVVEGCLKEETEPKANWTQHIDAVLTHRIWGWAAFAAVMAVMFYAIFSLASYPMDWIDAGFQALAGLFKAWLPAGPLRDLITDGIIAGVGGVVIFLPQILILFFFIALLQDTGYMARAAFIMDRLMNRVGLHGKSFIPLLSSFACAIPGIMATRSIETPKDRLVTILVAPLMTCSARLPVYTLMIAVLIPGTSAWQKTALMLGLYLMGVVGAIGMAMVFKKTILRGPTPPFIMELPPYRRPSVRAILWQMWERSQLFLRKAGTVIVALSVVLWALMSYPHHDHLPPGQALQSSYAGQIGMALEPVLKPLGFDWRIGIGLLGSFTAREVFVSTMSIVFNIDEGADGGRSLLDAFHQALWPDGHPLFTPLTCLSLMVFFVFAMQCISSIAIVRRETNSWRWPLFQVFYMTSLAYLMSFLVFQGGRLLGWT